MLGVGRPRGGGRAWRAGPHHVAAGGLAGHGVGAGGVGGEQRRHWALPARNHLMGRGDGLVLALEGRGQHTGDAEESL